MPRYIYKLVPAQQFDSNWDQRPTAEEQLAAWLAAEGEAGWLYPTEAVKVRVWETGSGGRHKHASLGPLDGTHLLVYRRV